METVKVNTSQHVDIDYPVAGLGERIAAYLIDYAIFFGIYIIFAIAIGLSAIRFSFNEIAILVSVIIYAVCYVFYDLLCEIFMNGQSVGKRTLKIKVVSLDGGQPTVGQYLIRWIFRIVDFVLTFGIGGFLSVAISENKQRIGDMVAGTTLIKTKPRATIDHIAFHPPQVDYTPVFESVHLMTDKDVELVHEVIQTYYQTKNPAIVYEMAEKIKNHLAINLPEGMNELEFLKTITADYNYITAHQ